MFKRFMILYKYEYAPRYALSFLKESYKENRSTRFSEEKLQKTSVALNLEKNCGILCAASLYRQPPKGGRLTQF